MKKKKQPGENISLKTKKSEHPLVMDWINSQSNLMDSLRYLIECEIVQNGVRNLQTFVPVERNVLVEASGERTTELVSRPQTLSANVAFDGVNEVSAGKEQVLSALEKPSIQTVSESVESDAETKLSQEPIAAVEQQAAKEDVQPSAQKERHQEIDDDIDDDDIDAWI